MECEDFNKLIPMKFYVLEEKIDLECDFFENRQISFIGTVFGELSNVNKYLTIAGKKKTVKSYGEKDYTHNVKLPYNKLLESNYCYLVLDLKNNNEPKIFEVKRINRDFTNNECVCNIKLLGDFKVNGNK